MISSFSIIIAFVLAVLSLGTFAVYSNHIIQSVRISSIINRITKDAREELERLYPNPIAAHDHNHRRDDADGATDFASGRKPTRIIPAPRPGVITDIRNDQLLKEAKKTDSTFVIIPVLGTYLPEGYPMIEVYGGDSADVLEHIEYSSERNLKNDIGYGLRQLADITIRALSTGINDPATAVQALDQLHDLLRRLVQRDLSFGNLYDDTGKLRVVLHSVTWTDILTVTVEEIRICGAESLQVSRRLRAMLKDLEQIAPPERKESLTEQLKLLDQAVEREITDPRGKELARRGDMRGTGF